MSDVCEAAHLSHPQQRRHKIDNLSRVPSIKISTLAELRQERGQRHANAKCGELCWVLQVCRASVKPSGFHHNATAGVFACNVPSIH